MINNEFKEISIKLLFEEGIKYMIPVYQRNYSWAYGEIEQLILDIQDSSQKKENKYYLGNLIVYPKKDEKRGVIYETIDGQQRLTSLFLILCALLEKVKSSPLVKLKSKLIFFSRPKSDFTLQRIMDASFDITGEKSLSNFAGMEHQINPNIASRYEDVLKILASFSPLDQKQFFDYFLNKVHILRITVPDDTDLNHYFEIINSRGVQLEKHEILHAQMHDILKDDPAGRQTLSKIWRAVSNMEKYVQYGFSTNERQELFGENWSDTPSLSFDDISSKLKSSVGKDNTTSSLKIKNIIESTQKNSDKKEPKKEHSDRFSSIINFQGFLLHVLRIYCHRNGTDISSLPALDDKRLIEQFENEVKSVEDVKRFAVLLLQCKHLYDHFVIKREMDNVGDRWSLKKLYRERKRKSDSLQYQNTFTENAELNKDILMTISMFHFSTPTMNYKYWLSACLNYLIFQVKNGKEINPRDYFDYLFKVAQSYFYDRVVSPEPGPIPYDEIIFGNKYETSQYTLSSLEFEKLNRGTAVENFAFNFLDLLLWRENRDTDFSFTARSSVEHYFPQNPREGEPLEKVHLDSFGNLALLSSSDNSRLSNLPPLSKKGHYKEMSNHSIKFRMMMDATGGNSPWDTNAIATHQEEMINLLKENYLKSNHA